MGPAFSLGSPSSAIWQLRLRREFTCARAFSTTDVLHSSALPPPPPRNWEPNPQRLWADFSGPQDKGKGKQLDADEVRTTSRNPS